MSGGSRVSIPNNVRRMIQDIKEIAGKHSDDDIYAMLKECNMDPNETAQKLLYIDTFHEVKKKRDRKNVNMSSRSEDYRWTAGMKGRSSRGGRGGYSSPYVSDGAGGGKNVSARKENGVNYRTQKGSRPSMPVLHKTEKNATTLPSHSSTVAANGPVNVPNESSSHESVPQQSAASVLGVYSSASDPVLDPSLNTKVPGAVGAIKREFGSPRITAEFSATLLDGNKSTTGQDVAKTSPAASGIVNSTSRTSPRKFHEVEERQMSEPSEFSSFPADNASRAISPNPVTQSPQQPSDPSKVVATEPSTVSFGNSQSLPQNDSVSEEATPDLDSKLEKLNLSPHQTVIFPEHLQVPEAFKSQLTFGSLDSIFGPKDSSSVADSVHVNSEAPKGPSLSNDIVSSATRDGDFSDNQQAPPHVPENNLKPLEDINVSSASVLKYEQSKQETISPPGGPQFPLLQSTPPDYNFGIVPPLFGSHLVQLEGLELQARDISGNPDLVSGKSPVPSTSGSIPSVTQPAAVAQSSIAVSPQLFPFFQQPYPSNYFPYNPYFPHLFFSQNGHQFLGHNGFPQQPSTGNVYMPPPAAAAATGGKLPVPSQYKLGTNAGNLTTHLGIPSCYGTYGGGSAVGYSPNAAAVIPGSSASTEDLAASDLKEKNSHSTTQQGEDSRVWSTATGREIPNLHPNYYYNLPQGQHVAFSPPQAGHGSFAGLYHPSQTTVTPPTVRSLIHQSHATAGSVDSVLPPPGPYQQPRIAQMNWNSTLLNRENM